MIISGLFTMLAKAKDYYSEMPGRNFVEKMRNAGFEAINNVYDALEPKQHAMKPARVPVSKHRTPGF